MKQDIDDYDLYDLDFEEWQRRGIEAFKEEAEENGVYGDTTRTHGEAA